MSIRFLTAGESHGPALCGIIEGFPPGINLTIKDFQEILLKRKKGYGRGTRSQTEPDEIEILSGLVGGKTIGSPIAIVIRNQDYENHKDYMHPFNPPSERGEIPVPLPGHGDFPGVIKYGFSDCRPVRERASARETAMRVALSVPAKKLLDSFGISSQCFVESISGIDSAIDWSLTLEEQAKKIAKNQEYFFTPDKNVVKKWIKVIDKAQANKQTLGGTGCVLFYNLPIGLGNYIQGDLRLDAKLAGQIMSIPAIKGVEIGFGKKVSEMQEDCTDGIEYHENTKSFSRSSNHAGGIEGGMSNGAPLILRFHMKPLPANSIKNTINLKTMEKAKTQYYRSDVCAVQAATVVAEALARIVIASELLKK